MRLSSVPLHSTLVKWLGTEVSARSDATLEGRENKDKASVCVLPHVLGPNLVTNQLHISHREFGG